MSSSVPPPPRRPRTRPILRVRTGCLTCRARKKKCDERKPRCRGCERNNLECKWAPPGQALQKPVRAPRREEAGGGVSRPSGSILQGHLVPTATSPVAGAYPSITAAADSMGGNDASPVGSNSPRRSSGASIHAIPVYSPDEGCGSSPNASSVSSSSAGVHGIGTGSVIDIDETAIDTVAAIPSVFDDDLAGSGSGANFFNPFGNDMSHGYPETSAQLPLGMLFNFAPKVPRNLNLLPGNHGSDSFELLSHYMAVTTRSMANGSTAENPFLVLLTPLAFGHDLILQLLLTQSAVHRAARSTNRIDQIAGEYYQNSLQLFRQNITKYIGGQSFEETLVLGVSALIMCFVETAKGDVNGTVFDHLMAAQPLLLPCLSTSSSLPPRLRNFLTEYYVYTATLSMISIDPRVSPQLFLTDDLQCLANELVTSGYIGNMCGCWLDLILLIPSIFDLYRRLMPNDVAQQSTVPTADDFVTFAQLHNQISSWTPSVLLDQDVFLAGRAFQQAMLLYLHTTLEPFPQADNGVQSASIESAVAEALSVLAQLDSSARINTSLCWPIAVVGSCATDPGQRAFLSQRLEHMFDTIGLGNIRQTVNLLERMWASPADGGACKAGPWNICQVMHENEIWISFA